MTETVISLQDWRSAAVQLSENYMMILDNTPDHWRWCNPILWTHISQDSAAMRLRYGGILNYCFARNVLLSLPVKEFWKSVIIWQSQRQK